MTGRKEGQINENTLTNEIADIVRERILKGEYQIGEKIKESSIAQELNVSRTPIREAFKTLEEEGLLDYLPNRGCYAKGFTKRDVSDIYTVREALEEIAMTWACERITDEEIDKLEEQCELMDFYTKKRDVQKILAMKPNSGTSGGLGFIKLELRGDGLYENNKPIDMVRFEEIRDTMRNYIITEYATQHHELAQVWPDSECTLRVIMCKNIPDDKYAPVTWSCVESFARFGASISGGASNLSTGGVGIGFDFTSGKYKDYGVRYRRFCPDGKWKIDRHPDTGYIWTGRKLPNWDYVRTKILKLCDHVSSLDYVGLDIIITENGLKLCEINSHPALDYSQVLGNPALKDENVRRFFNRKGLRTKNPETFYQAYMESQE